jgi:ribonucleoside-diphosphate reductase alpha chain
MKQAPAQDKTKNKSEENSELKNLQRELIASRKIKTEKTKKQQGFEWLTKHSRDFLSAGYLTNGESAEERIRKIADRAESILKINGFSDKFYHYMSEGF